MALLKPSEVRRAGFLLAPNVSSRAQQLPQGSSSRKMVILVVGQGEIPFFSPFFPVSTSGCLNSTLAPCSRAAWFFWRLQIPKSGAGQCTLVHIGVHIGVGATPPLLPGPQMSPAPPCPRFPCCATNLSPKAEQAAGGKAAEKGSQHGPSVWDRISCCGLCLQPPAFGLSTDWEAAGHPGTASQYGTRYSILLWNPLQHPSSASQYGILCQPGAVGDWGGISLVPAAGICPLQHGSSVTSQVMGAPAPVLGLPRDAEPLPGAGLCALVLDPWGKPMGTLQEGSGLGAAHVPAHHPQGSWRPTQPRAHGEKQGRG